MNKELKRILKYCKDSDINVVFTDSKILKDYSAMNPEAAKAMGFPDMDGDPETREIEIDRALPEETQIANLKHELIEMRLMRSGMQYWPAHEIALKKEREPFDFSQPMDVKGMNIIFAGGYAEEYRERDSAVQNPQKRGWHRRFKKPFNFGIIKGR
jgi:hypothetical protein